MSNDLAYFLQNDTKFLYSLFTVLFFFSCRPETALKNQEMELMRNKERLRFFKVQEKNTHLFLLRQTMKVRLMSEDVWGKGEISVGVLNALVNTHNVFYSFYSSGN